MVARDDVGGSERAARLLLSKALHGSTVLGFGDGVFHLQPNHGRVRKTNDGKLMVIYMHHEGDLFGQMDPFHESVHFFAFASS
jgi:hypothetical protein